MVKQKIQFQDEMEHMQYQSASLLLWWSSRHVLFKKEGIDHAPSLKVTDACTKVSAELSSVWWILQPHCGPLTYYHDRARNDSKARLMQPCSIAQRRPCRLVCRSSEGGLMKTSEMCVMLHVSTWWQSTQHSHPLNRGALLSTFLLSLLPSFPRLSFTSHNFPTPFLLFFFFLPLLLHLLSSFCSFVLLWHIPQERQREAEGEDRRERMEKDEKEKWNAGENVGDRSTAHLGRVSQQTERDGRSKANRKWQRWRGRATAKQCRPKNVETPSVLRRGKSISLLFPWQLYLCHLCFLISQMFISFFLYLPIFSQQKKLVGKLGWWNEALRSYDAFNSEVLELFISICRCIELLQ